MKKDALNANGKKKITIKKLIQIILWQANELENRKKYILWSPTNNKRYTNEEYKNDCC